MLLSRRVQVKIKKGSQIPVDPVLLQPQPPLCSTLEERWFSWATVCQMTTQAWVKLRWPLPTQQKEDSLLRSEAPRQVVHSSLALLVPLVFRSRSHAVRLLSLSKHCPSAQSLCSLPLLCWKAQLATSLRGSPHYKIKVSHSNLATPQTQWNVLKHSNQ